MSAYPEHDRMRAISDQSQTVGEFVEWLSSDKRIRLATYPDCISDTADHVCGAGDCVKSQHLYTVDTPIEKLLAEFFDIDLDTIEAEKRAMLDSLRAANDTPAAAAAPSL